MHTQRGLARETAAVVATGDDARQLQYDAGRHEWKLRQQRRAGKPISSGNGQRRGVGRSGERSRSHTICGFLPCAIVDERLE